MRTDIVDLGPQCEQGKSRDKVAEQIGIGSGRQYDRAKKVWAAAEAGDEDAVKAVKGIDQGSITIKVAYTQVQKIERQAQKREQQKVAEEVAEIQAKTSIQVTRGRFYKLGDHVLYCGDTSDIEFISRTPEAKFAFADPPYNAHVADWDIDFEWKHDWLANKSDITVVTPGTTSIFDFARITAMPYKWSIACFIKNGMARGALGFSNWIYAALFSAGSVFINSQDILEVVLKTSENNETEHRGRKPTEFIVWLIEKFTREGDMVIDPFLGSGTTLLACEATGRRCFGGEINPEFCQEIIGRWETLSGQKAEEVVING
ncbi:MAG: Modification methylase HindIII [Dehalococcoidia bacterium]|nr:Modification methylase HindIII [Bacillota bacterium]